MEKKQRTKLTSKNSTIKISLFACLIIFSCSEKRKNKISEKTIKTTKANETIAANQNLLSETKNLTRFKSVGYFDNDKIKDSIYYFLDKSKGEPIYTFEVFFGNRKTKTMEISSGSGNIQLSNCKVGCIEKSEITTGILRSEEIEKYQFDDALDNWFIFQTISKSNGDTIVNENFEEQWSIDDEMTK